ncbi:MAG TPA: TraB/GumN family protein [Steroidobacteraceae bacterium]|nr:TraB/GumN family protein [Steroidobacteraceae bacterium]
MKSLIARWSGACAALLLCSAGWSPAFAADSASAQHHILWSLQGKTNKIYLLGSIHMLQPSEQLPAAIDAAYADADSLLMEIDMDDLDAAQMQQDVMELAMQPEDQSLQQQLGPEAYKRFVANVQPLGVDTALFDRFKPWFAAITLVQVQMMKLGFDPASGVEQRLTQRASADRKPIRGLETAREQLEIMARLPDKQQREFLLYSVEDAQRMSSELDQLLSAWRRGDAKGMAKLLQEGFDEYPDLYRPLTVERNRKWVPQIEQLLDDEDDYLVVVGALHLVGTDSVIDLLERKGYKVEQL